MKIFYLCSRPRFFALLCVMSFVAILSSCNEDDSENFNSGKERLVGSWTIQGDYTTHISYNEMKYPTKIGGYRLYYNLKEEDLSTLPSYEPDRYKIFLGENLAFLNSKIIVFKINKQGYITNMISGAFESKGGYIQHDSTVYVYKDGYLTDIKSYYLDSKEEFHSILEWANGNLIRCYSTDMGISVRMGYSNKENKSQIYPIYINGVDNNGNSNDYYDFYFFGGRSFMALSNTGLLGKVSKNLIIQKTWHYGTTATYEYEFDEDGYVSSYVVDCTGENKSKKVSFFYQ